MYLVVKSAKKKTLTGFCSVKTTPLHGSILLFLTSASYNFFCLWLNFSPPLVFIGLWLGLRLGLWLGLRLGLRLGLFIPSLRFVCLLAAFSGLLVKAAFFGDIVKINFKWKKVSKLNRLTISLYSKHHKDSDLGDCNRGHTLLYYLNSNADGNGNPFSVESRWI